MAAAGLLGIGLGAWLPDRLAAVDAAGVSALGGG